MFNFRNLFVSLLITMLTTSALQATEESDQLAQAQKKLEDAAREYAELSSELGGETGAHIIKSFQFGSEAGHKSKARLGINIGEIKIETTENGESRSTKQKVDGVLVQGVSPDSPADKAGLRAGDVITSLNGHVLLDNQEESAIKQLTNVMSSVNPGDNVDVMYQRDGVTQSVNVTTDDMPKNRIKMMLGDKNFKFKGPGDFDIDIQDMEGLESLQELEIFKDMGDLLGDARFIFLHSSPLGDAELIVLSPELGEYFGASEGLLVVKAPSDESIGLRDGDVIRNIDGRVPTSVNQAMRILRSYESGETVNLEILRKKRKRKLSLLIPERKNENDSRRWSFEHESDGPEIIKKWISKSRSLNEEKT